MSSNPAPPIDTLGAGVPVVMAEVETSAASGQGEPVPEVPKKGLGQNSAQPIQSRMHVPQPETFVPSTSVVGSEVAPPPPPAAGRVNAGWPEEMEEALTGSSIAEEHRALIGAALQGFRSAEARICEVFKGLVKNFEVCFYTFPLMCLCSRLVSGVL